MLLNDEGNVLTWGDNDDGQLGHGEGKSEKSPRKISTLEHIFINRISCGAVHSMAVSKTGNAFVWGSNIRGQLGYDHKACKYLSVPTKIVLSLKEDVYQEEVKREVDPNDMQVDNLLSQEAEVDELAYDDLLDSVQHAVCGTWSSIFVTESRKTRLHIWGSENTSANVTKIIYDHVKDSNSIVSIKSRGDYILYLNKSGELFRYKISKQVTKPIDKIEKLQDLSLGADFLGVIHSKNTLYMRGTNKYGQLGTGDLLNRDEFEQILTIEPTRVKSVI